MGKRKADGIWEYGGEADVLDAIDELWQERPRPDSSGWRLLQEWADWLEDDVLGEVEADCLCDCGPEHLVTLQLDEETKRIAFEHIMNKLPAVDSTAMLFALLDSGKPRRIEQQVVETVELPFWLTASRAS